MTDANDKKQVVEWSFSFDDLANKIGDKLKTVGGTDAEVKHAQFSTPAEGVTSARVELELSVGRAVLKALDHEASLIEADVAYVGEIHFEATGEGVKKVKLSQSHPKTIFAGSIGSSIRKAIGGLVNNDELLWTIGLSRLIPMALNIEGGVGSSQIDLTGVHLTEFKLESGVGDTKLILPATGAHYEASVEGGVGSSHITILDGASLHLKLEAGVGGVQVSIPSAAAVRITVEGGLGGVNLPADFKRVQGKDEFMSKSGVWESEGYALSQQQITIAFEGGVGGFKLVRA
jgi:hypothetical protein